MGHRRYGYKADSGGGVDLTGLISYWKFDGNSNDSFGSNNGTDTSMSYGTDATVGKYADFTAGVSSKIEVADDDTLSFLDVNGDDIPLTWSVFVNFSAFNSCRLLSKYANPFEYHISYTNSSGGIMSAVLYDGDNNALIGARETSLGLSLNTWYHFAFTSKGDGIPNNNRIYLDGLDVSDILDVGAYEKMRESMSKFYLGHGGNNNNNSLNGLLAHVSIWGVDKDLAGVNELYDLGINATDLL